MTKYQILLTLYHFLDEEFRENSDRSETFREYLGSINPYLWTDGKTADPSYYADFMEIADTLFEDFENYAGIGLQMADEMTDWNQATIVKF